MAPTDLELRVGGSVGGSSRRTLDFPPISVVNGAEKAFGARLEVTLPAEVSLVSVSAANAICSGTTVLRCDFDELEADSHRDRESERAGRQRAAASAARCKRQRRSTTPMPPTTRAMWRSKSRGSRARGGSDSGGGGGGGRFEWLAWRCSACCGGHRHCRKWRT